MAHQDIPLTTESTSWIKMQDAGTTSDYTSGRMVTASPQPTVSWSQGQSTSHCNLATQLQCSHARGSQRQFKCDNSQVRTSNNLSADAQGISTAEVSIVH